MECPPPTTHAVPPKMNPIKTHMKRSTFARLSATVGLVALVSAPNFLCAADLTWTGALSGTWDTTTANWSGTSSTFTGGDNALFSGTPTTNVTAATGLTIGSINLQSGFTGSVTLTGANTVNGTTTVSAGTLNLGNSGALGTSAVTLAGGNVIATAGITTTNGIAAQSGTSSNLSVTGVNWNLNGNLTGSGDITRTYTSGSAATVYLGGDNSGFSGTFTMTNNANAVVRFSTTSAGSASAKWVFNQAQNNTRTTVDFTSGTIKFGSFTGNGFLTSQGAAGTRIYEVGALGLNETFSGAIGQTGTGVVTAVTKVGTGTWTLSGSNTYTGATTINAGTLALGAANRIADTSALVLGGGTFATGGFSETLGTLTVSSASTIDFGTGTSALVFADSNSIAWTGIVTLLNFDIGTDSLKFGSTSGALTSDQLGKINLAGFTASLDSSGFVTFSAIPEPSAYATLAGLAAFGGVAVRRRRR